MIPHPGSRESLLRQAGSSSNGNVRSRKTFARSVRHPGEGESTYTGPALFIPIYGFPFKAKGLKFPAVPVRYAVVIRASVRFGQAALPGVLSVSLLDTRANEHEAVRLGLRAGDESWRFRLVYVACDLDAKRLALPRGRSHKLTVDAPMEPDGDRYAAVFDRAILDDGPKTVLDRRTGREVTRYSFLVPYRDPSTSAS